MEENILLEIARNLLRNLLKANGTFRDFDDEDYSDEVILIWFENRPPEYFQNDDIPKLLDFQNDSFSNFCFPIISTRTESLV